MKDFKSCRLKKLTLLLKPVFLFMNTKYMYKQNTCNSWIKPEYDIGCMRSSYCFHIYFQTNGFHIVWKKFVLSHTIIIVVSYEIITSSENNNIILAKTYMYRWIFTYQSGVVIDNAYPYVLFFYNTVHIIFS